MVSTPTDYDCLRRLMALHEEHCGRFDDYSLKYVRHLVHACETESKKDLENLTEKLINSCVETFNFVRL